MFVVSRIRPMVRQLWPSIAKSSAVFRQRLAAAPSRARMTLPFASSLAISVCQGDVIETAADGRIGIRFIDGTVFNLSCNTRVVLNEFVCDSTGTLHSALFGVTKGAFAFFAGQAARTGYLKIDTPFGSIRGRAHTGGIGMLSLTALTFSLLKEVRPPTRTSRSWTTTTSPTKTSSTAHSNS